MGAGKNNVNVLSVQVSISAVQAWQPRSKLDAKAWLLSQINLHIKKKTNQTELDNNFTGFIKTHLFILRHSVTFDYNILFTLNNKSFDFILLL